MRRMFLTTAFLVLALPAAARADAPLPLNTVRLPGIDGGGTEPRIIVGPDDSRYAVTSVSRATGSGAVVFRSRDRGMTWQATPARPAGQVRPTIDVDVVAMHTGRILASELDFAGVNFPSSYSDDGGATWTQSRGSTQLADQDRQWFAVGPDDKSTGKPTVYLLFHNLTSGEANHNMFVSKSIDGGATFGVPVPVALPGSGAYADLQCADSGGPSNITVDATGRIYVFFTTRAAPVPGGLDLGGCAAQPLEFNIVNATRVWVASSTTGGLGSFKDTLAVDDSSTGQIVSMQLAYGAVDNQGGVYVAYPESPQAYPQLGGAAVKLVYQHPGMNGELVDGGWTRPVTLVPSSNPQSGGSTLVHLVAGDPGNIAVAYYHASGGSIQDKPVWFTHLVHSFDVLSATPTITDQQVSNIPTYKWTASEMMGICSNPKDPLQGVENGLACNRSTDVWGITLDAACRVSFIWPTNAPPPATPGAPAPGGSTHGLPNSQSGTYVSTQNTGRALCAGGHRPASATFPAASSTSSPPRARHRRRAHPHRRAARHHPNARHNHTRHIRPPFAG